MPQLNIASIINKTEAEGPGVRMAIWVQGCLKRCPSCCNPEFLPIRARSLLSTVEICALILKNKQTHNIKGITLLGGEPLLQAQGLAEIAQYSQSIGLSVMLFTGYNKTELLESQFAGATKLLHYTDLLIDGEYLAEQNESSRNWVGSSNQAFHYLSNTYDRSIETQALMTTNEWRIAQDGTLLGNGLPFIIKS